MTRKYYFSVSLSCQLHTPVATEATGQSEGLLPLANDDPTSLTALDTGQCLPGVISRTPTGFLFEETVRKARRAPNPKLYDGKYVSLVRRVNGKYQVHAKAMSLERGTNLDALTREICKDIINALQIIM